MSDNGGEPKYPWNENRPEPVEAASENSNEQEKESDG